MLVKRLFKKSFYFILILLLNLPIFFPQHILASDRVYGWTKSMGGSGNTYERGVSITTDTNGNIFVTGGFETTVNFDDTWGIDNHTSNGGSDIFITKYNSDGSYGWTKSIGGTGTDYGNEITLDTNGNIFVTGYFQTTVNFDDSGGTDNHTASGNYNIFFTKYNSDGSYGWTKSIGGTGYDSGFGITLDTNDNIFVTGEFGSTVNFDDSGGTDNHTSNGDNDIFITKYNADGSYGWTKSFGGSGPDYGQSITTDTNGNVFATGFFENTVNFDDTGGTDNRTSSGSRDIFITKYNADGSYGWTKIIGGTGYDWTEDIATDTNGNVFVTGLFSNTVNFDDSGGTDNHTADSYDIFITKYNSDGSYGWTKSIGGTGTDKGYGIAFDTNDNIFVTGYFQNTVNFDDTGGIDNHTSSGGSDIFITKYNSDGSYGWTKSIGGTGNDNGLGITLDTNNNIFVTGRFNNTVNFDDTGGTDNHTSGGGYDIFITKYTDDSSAPSLSLTSLSPDPNNDNTPAVSGTATDALGTVSSVEYQMDSTSGSWSSCTASDGTFDEASEAFTCTTTSLSDGSHTIYVRATDSNSNTTTNANASTDSFTIDISTPSSFDLVSPGHEEYVSDSRPVFKWRAASTPDTTSGISHYKFEVIYEVGGGYLADSINPSGTSDHETDKYIIKYENFSDSDNSNNYISLQTKSSSQWGKNNGEIKSGTNNWSVRAVDHAGNEKEQSRIVYLGSAPTPTPTPTPIPKILVKRPSLETKITKEEKIPAETEEERERIEKEGYIVQIKVVDEQGNPVEGAKVTLYSDPKVAYTNQEGIATFKGIEPGEHKVLIAYDGKQGEQKINLTGDIQEFHYEIQIKETSPFLSPLVIAIFGFLVVSITLFSIFLFKKKPFFIS